MKIIAKQAAKNASTIKLPDSQCAQTGRETLKEIFGVHFQHLMPVDDKLQTGTK
jgi:hypothetical protein